MSKHRSKDLEPLAKQTAQQHSLSCGDGKEVLVLVTPEGAYFSIPDICRILQITKESQIRRIGANEKLKQGLQVLPLITPGGLQRTSCLHQAHLGSWLTSISLKNAPPISPKQLHMELQGALSQVLPLFPPVPSRISYIERGEEREEPAALLPAPPDPDELREILAKMSPNTYLTDFLPAPSYKEDTAVREAALAPGASWIEDADRSTLQYVASNALQVYFGDPQKPLEIPTAFERMRRMGERTALTARIILALWTLRRYNNQVAKNGSVPIRRAEILEIRGIKKHTQGRYTDGYRKIHLQQVDQDILLLQQYYLRGHYKFMVRGKLHHVSIDGPYLRVSEVKEENIFGEEQVVGYMVSPGDWINTYADHEIFFFAEVDRRIFQLDPHNQQHELRLALYLSERWRQLAKSGNYTDPIVMEDLLAFSMIQWDKENFTNRFIPRIEGALKTLFNLGIIGEEAECLDPIDDQETQRKIKWLRARWKVVPPLDLIDKYMTTDKKILDEPQGNIVDSY